jgi:hypothetical protein
VSRRKGLVPRRPLKTTDASLPARLQQEPPGVGREASPRTLRRLERKVWKRAEKAACRFGSERRTSPLAGGLGQDEPDDSPGGGVSQ